MQNDLRERTEVECIRAAHDVAQTAMNWKIYLYTLENELTRNLRLSGLKARCA